MQAKKLIALTVFLGLGAEVVYGQAAALPGNVAQRMAAVEACLSPPVTVKGEPKACTTLQKRMEVLHIPGVSIAVVYNGAIEWAKGYGVRQTGGDAVNTETMFQAGSISKPVAALGTLHLVQEGKLSLDADINTSLMSWKLPASAAASGAVVTLRELLTHTAGLTVHGFPGYAAGVQFRAWCRC